MANVSSSTQGGFQRRRSIPLAVAASIAVLLGSASMCPPRRSVTTPRRPSAPDQRTHMIRLDFPDVHAAAPTVLCIRTDVGVFRHTCAASGRRGGDVTMDGQAAAHGTTGHRLTAPPVIAAREA